MTFFIWKTVKEASAECRSFLDVVVIFFVKASLSYSWGGGQKLKSCKAFISLIIGLVLVLMLWKWSVKGERGIISTILLLTLKVWPFFFSGQRLTQSETIFQRKHLFISFHSGSFYSLQSPTILHFFWSGENYYRLFDILKYWSDVGIKRKMPECKVYKRKVWTWCVAKAW